MIISEHVDYPVKWEDSDIGTTVTVYIEDPEYIVDKYSPINNPWKKAHRDQRVTVIRIDEEYDSALCRAPDGTEGWLFPREAKNQSKQRMLL